MQTRAQRKLRALRSPENTAKSASALIFLSPCCSRHPARVQGGDENRPPRLIDSATMNSKVALPAGNHSLADTTLPPILACNDASPVVFGAASERKRLEIILPAPACWRRADQGIGARWLSDLARVQLRQD